MLVKLFNGFIEIITVICTAILALMPTTPFQFDSLEWGEFGNVIGLVFPVGDMALHFTALLVSIGLYYAVRGILRLLKQVQ